MSRYRELPLPVDPPPPPSPMGPLQPAAPAEGTGTAYGGSNLDPTTGASVAHICSGWCNHPELPTVTVTAEYLLQRLQPAAPAEGLHSHPDDDFVAMAQRYRAEHEATHGEAEQCGGPCIVLGLAGDDEEPAAPAEGLDPCPHCDIEHVWPCPTIPRCDEPGCEKATSCGFPTDTGYRRTCGDHYRAAEANR